LAPKDKRMPAFYEFTCNEAGGGGITSVDLVIRTIRNPKNFHVIPPVKGSLVCHVNLVNLGGVYSPLPSPPAHPRWGIFFFILACLTYSKGACIIHKTAKSREEQRCLHDGKNKS
jgi:hypothetical protein